MKTNQPSWHCIANIGDATPIDHGGEFIMIDKRGVYTPELWIYTPAETEGKPGTWGTVLMELCTRVKGAPEGTVSDNRFHPDHATWFSLPDIASYIGESVYRVSDAICSSDPLERAWIYSALVSYYGIENFGGDEPSDSLKFDRKRINLLLKQIEQAEKWTDGIAA